MAAAKVSKFSVKTDTGLLQAMAAAFTVSALPGENEGFDSKACNEAARFTLALARQRHGGTPAVALDTFAGVQDRLAMRIAINNDDMPFLVDSISAALAARGVSVKRLIHPVLTTQRDASGVLQSVSRKHGSGNARESFIYLETDRVDGKERRLLERALVSVLSDVRGAVTDWRKMLDAMAADAESLPDSEGEALIRWFLNGNMTVLGHEHIAVGGARSRRLGLSRVSDLVMLSEQSIGLAIKWFDKGGQTPLVLKANRVSTVHRHVQLDVVVVPINDGSGISGISITAGLWTSAALATAPENIPVLRMHLATLMERFGFRHRSGLRSRARRRAARPRHRWKPNRRSPACWRR